ncbi:MAG: hypothetical protein AAF632_09780 [Bacteroidota bacterium]
MFISKIKNLALIKMPFNGIFMLLALFALSLSSCSDDDADADTVPDVPEEPGELATGVAIIHRIITPESDTWYLSAHETVPETYDVSQALEVGQQGANPAIFDGAVYVANQGTYTKYVVDRTDLSISVGGSFDLTSVGSTQELADPVSFSETEAYFVDYRIGRVIEFNPEAMEIVATYDFDPLPIEGWIPFNPEGFDQFSFGHVRGDDVVICPILTREFNSWTTPNEAQILVFDRNTKQVRYEIDERYTSNDIFPIQLGDGSYIIGPTWHSNLYEDYGDFEEGELVNENLAMRVLRDGTIDPDFGVDYAEILDVDYIRQTTMAFGNDVIVSYWPDGTESGEGPFGIFDNPTEKAVINLDDETSRPFNALTDYSNFFVSGSFEGSNLIIGFGQDGAQNAILRQDGIDDYTILVQAEGQFRDVNQLW